jgi:hypothetical protein
MKKKKIKKDLREDCDKFEKCGNKADINLQNVWVEYECLKNGEYRKNKEWEGDSNEHLCEDCYEKEMSVNG